MIEVKFQKLHPEAILPRNWSPESVGYDIHAFCLTENGRPNKILVPPRNTRNIETKLRIEPPPGHFIMICSRSGLAKRSFFVTNAPGIIDPDYRGEVKVLFYNGGLDSHYIQHGDRIAQFVVVPVTPISVVEVKALTETQRGESGFGSTGT